MKPYRPQKLNTWINSDVKSEFEVEHIELLRLDQNSQEKRPLMNRNTSVDMVKLIEAPKRKGPT